MEEGLKIQATLYNVWEYVFVGESTIVGVGMKLDWLGARLMYPNNANRLQNSFGLLFLQPTGSNCACKFKFVKGFMDERGRPVLQFAAVHQKSVEVVCRPVVRGDFILQVVKDSPQMFDPYVKFTFVSPLTGQVVCTLDVLVHKRLTVVEIIHELTEKLATQQQFDSCHIGKHV